MGMDEINKDCSRRYNNSCFNGVWRSFSAQLSLSTNCIFEVVQIINTVVGDMGRFDSISNELAQKLSLFLKRFIIHLVGIKQMFCDPAVA